MGLSLPCLCSAIQCATYPCKLLHMLDQKKILATFILGLTFCSVILLFFLSRPSIPLFHLELTVTVLSPVCSKVQSPPIPPKTRHPVLLDRADSSLRVMSIQWFLNCIQILPCCFSKLLCRPSSPPPSTRSWVVPYLSRPTSDP